VVRLAFQDEGSSVVRGEGARRAGGGRVGKETDYKHLEHGLEVSGSRYTVKGFGTYKGRLHAMAPRTISTVTSNEHGTGIREDTRRCGGGGKPFHGDIAKIKRRSLLNKGGTCGFPCGRSGSRPRTC